VTGLMRKVLRWDSPDNDYYTISRFEEDLGGGFWLASRLAPIGGGDLGSYHLVSLSELSTDDGADIYDNFEACAVLFQSRDVERFSQPVNDLAQTGGGYDLISLRAALMEWKITAN
jgi:hypothetical protein